MPFTTDQADELIAIIQSVRSGGAQAIADLPHQLITALKKVNTLNEETRKLD
jgi:hypothetical protein